jgi:ferredoxin-nitrite reductase
LSAGQLRLLADLAETHGRGRLRLTHLQNIILPDLPEDKVTAIMKTLAVQDLPANPDTWHGRIVACTGKAHCNKACAHTRETALVLAEELESVLPGAPISLHISGCPNGCGQHAIADVGLQGAVTRGEQGLEERFDLWAGGGQMPEPAFARRIASRLRPEEVTPYLATLFARYQAEATSEETFSTYIRRVTDPVA